MPKQKHCGVCHICGKYGKLSYEHIPPQSAFNNVKRKMSTLEELLKDETENRTPWDIEGLKYQQFQKGIGFYTLCESCNNFTGGKYGEAYFKFVKSIGIEVMKIPKEERKNSLAFHIEPLNLLAIFKQILSMFCSLNTEQFGNTFKDFLLNESSNGFDCDKYKICIYLHAGHADRFIPFQSRINTKTGKVDVFSEISTFPIGFIFYNITDNTQFYGCDITSFSQCNYNLEYCMDIPIPFLECNTPFGLDFRSF